MLSRETLEAWVTALRSGKYEQGTGALYRDGKHCCLGVLMEVLGAERSAFTPNCRAVYTWEDKKFGGTISTTLLPSTTQNRLIQFNDGGNCPFPRIADWIEDNIEPEEETP